MAMPKLDPTRYSAMRLADPTHTLPMPGAKRFFSQAPTGETVDMHDPFWMMLAADGSIVPAAETTTTAPAA
jgi:hypothetical protein